MARCITDQQDHVCLRQTTWEAVSPQRLQTAWARSFQAVVLPKAPWPRRHRRQRLCRMNKLNSHTTKGWCSTNTEILAPAAVLPAIVSSTTMFQFDIIVHVTQQHHSRASRRVMRRVLLDTGAKMNMVSAAALHGIQFPVKGRQCEIRSIAGTSRIMGQTDLSFHFLDDVATEGAETSTFEEEFNLLDDNEQPLFDMVLGQEWISRHFLKFFDLTSSKASVQNSD